MIAPVVTVLPAPAAGWMERVKPVAYGTRPRSGERQLRDLPRSKVEAGNGRIENGDFEIAASAELQPEMCLYREVTRSMLRRYLQMSIELGRLPSLIGREFFRSRVTSYRVHSFEDVVIFVHDMERCLSKLEAGQQKVIARVVLQDYPYDEAAPLLGCTRKTVRRRTDEALDELTAILLEVGLLNEKCRRRAVKG